MVCVSSFSVVASLDIAFLKVLDRERGTQTNMFLTCGGGTLRSTGLHSDLVAVLRQAGDDK